MAGEESKILSDGVMLLITSLLSGIISLGVYIWVNSRRENDRRMNLQDKKIEALEAIGKDHEGRILRLEFESEIDNTPGGGK